jgi:hypothetical protein
MYSISQLLIGPITKENLSLISTATAASVVADMENELIPTI